MIEIKKNCTLETTWKELRDDIKAASNPLNVGDEIDIVLKTGEKVTLVCERAGHRSATFFTKNLLEDTHCMNENWKAKNGEQLSTMEAYLGKLFLLLPDDLQEVVTEPLRLLREKENRVKTLNNVPFPYWLASPYASNSAHFCCVVNDGSSYYYTASTSYGVCYGFDI
nr:MAG TPA: hypothetical protein [Bacteriophage sp.]